jgi:CHASE2 domain-containing sensor protein
MHIATRLFVRNVWLQAVVMALASVALTEILWAPAPVTYHALEWAPYDTWMRLRSQPAPDSHLLLVIRDQASEQQFGAGMWDRSLPARLITGLHDAGAAAIGLDIPLDLPSPPNLGGAVSDALLTEAVTSAGTVSYPAFSTAPGEQETAPLRCSPTRLHAGPKRHTAGPGPRSHYAPGRALSRHRDRRTPLPWASR